MSRLSLEQLRSFLFVVRLGGVRKAAEALSLTQPAVTARIKALESTLGAELFDRTPSGMRLTKRGELLVAYAEQFEQLSEIVSRDVIDPAGIEGRIRIGVSETIAQCWLPELIARLHSAYPNIVIEFNVDISTNLRSGLLDRSIDLAVLVGPISEYSVDNVELPGFELAWYASATAPPVADPSEYFKGPVLTYARQTRPYRNLRDMLFERLGPGVAIFPSSSLSACFRLVEANLGVAALPVALGASHVAEKRIRTFDPGWVPPPLKFTASYLAEPSSHLIRHAATIAREVAEDFDSDQKK